MRRLQIRLQFTKKIVNAENANMYLRSQAIPGEHNNYRGNEIGDIECKKAIDETE